MKYLYKFSEINSDKLKSLSLNKLWFSKLSDLNDPFEGEYVIRSQASGLSEIITAMKGKLYSNGGNGNPELMDAIKQLELRSNEKISEKEIIQLIELFDGFLEEHIQAAKKICTCSFIQKSNGNDPLLNNLMWSHYANGLRGYCLKYDEEKLFQTSGTESNPILTKITVGYVDAVKSMNSINYFSENFHEYFPGIFLPARIKMYNLFSTKSKDWEYENECRFLSGQMGGMPHSGDALKEVIIGEKISQKHLEQLKTSALKSNPNVVFKKAIVKTGTYNIELVDVNS